MQKNVNRVSSINNIHFHINFNSNDGKDVRRIHGDIKNWCNSSEREKKKWNIKYQILIIIFICATHNLGWWHTWEKLSVLLNDCSFHDIIIIINLNIYIPVNSRTKTHRHNNLWKKNNFPNKIVNLLYYTPPTPTHITCFVACIDATWCHANSITLRI